MAQTSFLRDIAPSLIFGGILFLITRNQNRKFMDLQERLDALDARYAKATDGLAADIRKLTEQSRANTVTEETLSRLERRADVLDQLDAETPNDAQAGNGGSTGEGEEGAEGDGEESESNGGDTSVS